MNEKDLKATMMKYFYKDSTGYHPLFTSDCRVWNEMFIQLFGGKK